MNKSDYGHIDAATENGRRSETQTRMIFRRFMRHKLGVVGAAIILLLVVVFLFGDFISPYNKTTTHFNYPYVPPMVTRIHFDGLQPFVYGLKKTAATIDYGGVTQRLPGVWDYTEDTDKKIPIRFFVQGDPYKLLGLVPTDIHLFGTGEPPTSSGQIFLLGTDSQGRDLFSQILYGGRVTLGIGPLVIVISFLLGTVIGGLSGYLGGWVDTLIQRALEVFMSLPRLALLLAISGILTFMGNVPPMARFWSIAGLLSLVSWAPIARVIRGQFLALRESEYTLAAGALGANSMRIIFRHIMPNIMSYLVVAATLTVPDIIILESVLSFLGYGIQYPMISWGMLLNFFVRSGFHFQITYHAWLLFPAGFIVVCVLAFNFLGDALRDAVDPFAVQASKEYEA